jgi:hypothetical protein
VTGGYVGMVSAISGSILTNSSIYVQEAIWHLENERTATGVSLALANAAVAQKQSWIDLESAGHRVYAMNLTAIGDPTALKQDQLVYVPVPEPGSTLALLASVAPVALFGYLGIGASRVLRRRRRSI